MCSDVADVAHGFYYGMLDGMEDIEGIRMVEALSEVVHGSQCFSARIAVSREKSGKQKKREQIDYYRKLMATITESFSNGRLSQTQAYLVNCRCF